MLNIQQLSACILCYVYIKYILVQWYASATYVHNITHCIYIYILYIQHYSTYHHMWLMISTFWCTHTHTFFHRNVGARSSNNNNDAIILLLEVTFNINIIVSILIKWKFFVVVWLNWMKWNAHRTQRQTTTKTKTSTIQYLNDILHEFPLSLGITVMKGQFVCSFHILRVRVHYRIISYYC